MGFILVGKLFRKAFRILELDNRNGGLVVGSFENEVLENEDQSTKHPNLENEAP